METMGEHEPAQIRGRALQCIPPRRLSDILLSLASAREGPITIGRLREAIGDRSFAALLVLFASINLIPLPPGSTLIFGIPLMLVSGQMVLGYRTAWLPRFVLDKSIDQQMLDRSSRRFIPMLERLERFIKPRHWPFPGSTADRPIGIFALILSIVVFLPIPLGNWLPAFSIALIGLALSERDGILLLAGVSIGVLSLIVIGAVVGTAGFVASSVFGLI